MTQSELIFYVLGTVFGCAAVGGDWLAAAAVLIVTFCYGQINAAQRKEAGENIRRALDRIETKVKTMRQSAARDGSIYKGEIVDL